MEISRNQIQAIFKEWETQIRLQPQKFFTKEDIVIKSVDEISERRTISFLRIYNQLFLN